MSGLPHVVVWAVLAVLAPSVAYAQIVEGTVVADSSGGPIAGAAIVLAPAVDGRSLETRTDSLGMFSLAVAAGEAYKLRVRHPGYIPYDADLTGVGSGEIVALEVRMGTDAIPLEPLVVTAQADARFAGFERRRRAYGSGRFLTRQELEARGAARTSQLLRGTAGLTFREVGRGRGTLVLMHSGLGLCSPAIYIDGQRADQTRDATIDDMLLPSMIEAVEVYTSSTGIPAQFGAEACGVMAFWTHRGDRSQGGPWQWKRALIGLGSAAVMLILLIR
jgi:hypothetical protein